MQDNLSGNIKTFLPQNVIKLLSQAGDESAKSGHNLYLVGGIVRDLMLGRTARDIDIMTTGPAANLAMKLAASSGVKLTLHRKFGTATFHLDDYRIDISTCRSETYQHPGALPDVKPGNINDDLFRRDFTINAMAINIHPGHFGDLIDLHGGRHDLKEGLVRILHDKSFQDDATRIMRAVRYEQRLGFKLENKTGHLLQQNLPMLDTISNDRLKHELLLWLNEEYPCQILQRADRLGILVKLHSNLKWNSHLATSFKRASANYLTTDRIPLYFCLLVYRLDEKSLYEMLQRLNLTGSKYDLLCHQALEIKNIKPVLIKKKLSNSELYFCLNKFLPAAVQANWAYPNHRLMRSRLKIYLTSLAGVKISIGGAGLTRLGVEEGPLIGKILHELLIARLDGKVKTRNQEEELALAIADRSTSPSPGIDQ